MNIVDKARSLLVQTLSETGQGKIGCPKLKSVLDSGVPREGGQGAELITFVHWAESEVGRIARLLETEQEKALEAFEKRCVEFDSLPEEIRRKALVQAEEQKASNAENQEGPVRIYSRILDEEVYLVPDDWEQEMDVPSYTHSELERLNQINLSADELRDIHRISEGLGGEIVAVTSATEESSEQKDARSKLESEWDDHFNELSRLRESGEILSRAEFDDYMYIRLHLLYSGGRSEINMCNELMMLLSDNQHKVASELIAGVEGSQDDSEFFEKCAESSERGEEMCKGISFSDKEHQFWYKADQ